jgi:hypothetical protein
VVVGVGVVAGLSAVDASRPVDHMDVVIVLDSMHVVSIIDGFENGDSRSGWRKGAVSKNNKISGAYRTVGSFGSNNSQTSLAPPWHARCRANNSVGHKRTFVGDKVKEM